jgi:hypothetical protein
MPIVPDTKNWTFVLEVPCPECSFDASRVGFREVPGLVRSTARAFAERLQEPGADVRPDDSTWSPLEYGAHVRDVFRVFETRLALLLAEEGPRFANWDQDAAAVDGDYASQDPRAVALELVASAESVADAFSAVDASQLDRVGSRSDGSVFTVETLARYFVHDPVHHLWDVSAR